MASRFGLLTRHPIFESLPFPPALFPPSQATPIPFLDVAALRSIALQRALTWQLVLVVAHLLQDGARAPKEFGIAKVTRVRAPSGFSQHQHFVDGFDHTRRLVPCGVFGHDCSSPTKGAPAGDTTSGVG